MSFHYWLALTAMATAPIAASAQQAHPPQPSPEATAVVYQSAFANYKLFTNDEAPPETKWRAVNEEMSKLDGHAAHIKSDGAAPSTAPAQAKPATEQVKAGTPVDHSKHH